MALRRGAGRGAFGLSPARLAAVVILAALVWLSAVAGARAYSFPPLTGRVVDAANILDPVVEAELEARLAAQEEANSDQIVVATVSSLEGGSVEDYANELFRAWGIGQRDKNNGVLLLVAPNEREVRIEVGYGLEGILTDAVASTIIRNAIVPSFKAGDMPDGILKGVDAIIEVLNLDPEEARARAQAAEEEMTLEDWLSVALVLAFVGIALYFAWRNKGRGGSDDGTLSSGWGGDDDRGSGGWSGGGGSSGGGGASGRW